MAETTTSEKFDLGSAVEQYQKTGKPEDFLALQEVVSRADKPEKDAFKKQLRQELSPERLEEEENIEERQEFKNLMQKIEDYLQIVEEKKEIKGQIEELKHAFYDAYHGVDEDQHSGYVPKKPTVSNRQLAEISAKKEDYEAIESNLAAKLNELKALSIEIFELAKNNTELEKIRQALERNISEGDLKHELLHPYAIKIIQEHLSKAKPVEAKQQDFSRDTQQLKRLPDSKNVKKVDFPSAQNLVSRDTQMPPEPVKQPADDSKLLKEDGITIETVGDTREDALNSSYPNESDARKVAEMEDAMEDDDDAVDRVDLPENNSSGIDFKLDEAEAGQSETVNTQQDHTEPLKIIKDEPIQKPKEEPPRKPQGIVKIEPNGVMRQGELSQKDPADSAVKKESPISYNQRRVEEIQQSLKKDTGLEPGAVDLGKEELKDAEGKQISIDVSTEGAEEDSQANKVALAESSPEETFGLGQGKKREKKIVQKPSNSGILGMMKNFFKKSDPDASEALLLHQKRHEENNGNLTE